ncbi:MULTISPECIES: Zn-ribbon domain-containing OB-fold protein [unclassified Pseudonocardia]|uniref:Zn-ribbon domain-containing OB-fold protein n=1 Tax=unclassified Pseudonocardia TaxID=2619320 RepID=UPI001D045848|nr:MULTISPECIES: OB-fold domain-containing protein [unclassified Pseudonocardia]
MEVSGHGRVLSWTVSRTSRAERPLVPAFVELAEGPTLLTRLTDVEPADVEIGMPVTVVFREDEVAGAPQFVPVRR